MGKRKYYGVIGNGETCAFVSPYGNIEWLCLPQFDGKIIYSKAVNSMGGSLDIQLNENGKQLSVKDSRQEYMGKSAILTTTLYFETIKAAITDFMPWPEPEAMESEKRFIFRLVEIKNTSGKNTTVSLKIRSNVGSRKYREVKESEIISMNTCAFALTFLGNNFEKIKLKPKETKEIPIVFIYGKARNEVKSMLSRKRVMNPWLQLKKCNDFWHNWVEKGRKIEVENSEYRRAYYNSVVVLKLMNFDKAGSILAAATTSLPASPVGTHSWDYRFVWIRDAYYACRALLQTGHFEEAKKQLAFFFRIQGKDGHWASPFYNIDGAAPGNEIDVDLGEDIIRINNGAKDQLQLDSEGSVIHCAYLYLLYSHDANFVKKHWNNIKAAANWVEKNYSREENGIWEFRNKTSHWTYGKVMCYLAMDSAMNIADEIGEKIPEHWTRIRSQIRSDAVRYGWSNHRNAFLQLYDKDSSVDISALALEDYGLVSPFDKRMHQTVKLMEEKLNMNGGIKRNEDAQLPLYFSTLWLAAHYIRAGKQKRAEELIDVCLESSTSLYLCAEHFDARNKIQYGNFPQTFSTSMLVERILDLQRRKYGIENIFGLINSELRRAIKYDREELIKWSERTLRYRKKE